MRRKIIINGKNYSLDLELAMKFGCAKECYTPITTFKPGDVFTLSAGTKVAIVPYNLPNMFILGGHDDRNGWAIWTAEPPRTFAEMLSYINDNELIFVKHNSFKLD